MMKASSYPCGQFEGNTDIGEGARPGSCSYDEARERYVVDGAGANIWDARDDFHFVWKRMSGDFIVTARATFEGEGANAHRKLGWMARTSLDPDAPHVSAVVHGDGLLALQFRRSRGGETEEVRSPLTDADVVRLERRGTTWIVSTARFGEPFTTVQVDGVDPGGDTYVGLFVCSHGADTLERAVFDNVRVVVPVGDGFDRAHDPFGSRLEVLDVVTGDRRVRASADYVLEAPNWTRDGKALIYNSGGRLYRFDLDSREASPIDTGDVVDNNNDHVISFDGSTLAVSSHSREDGGSVVYTVPLIGGRPRRVTPNAPSYLHGWSPDGRFLVYTGARDGEFDVYRISVDGGEEERLTTAPGLDDGPEYTADGEYIYFNSVRSGLMQIWRMKPDGSGQEQLTDDEYNNWFPHVSPDGRRIAFVSYLADEVDPADHPPAKRVYLRLMPRDGGEPRVIAYVYGGQGTMNVPSWSPDGTQLAFVSNTVPFG